MRHSLVYIAAITQLVAVLPYVFDMFRGKTRPNVVSWLAWAILGYIELAALLAHHSYTPAILSIGSVSGLTLVVLFGLKYGFAKFNKLDAACMAGAGLAGFLWWYFNSPSVALFTSIAIDFIVAGPTVYHAWNRFREETFSTYVISTAGGAITMVALTSYALVDVVYPLMIIAIDASIALAIVHGRVKYHNSRLIAAKKAARTRRRNRRVKRKFVLAGSR